jgi:glycosyltransferase domain-containing protein
VLESDLARITIVIPTIERQEYVIRQFKYWMPMPVKILILDGATNPMEIPTRYQSPNIQYLHSPTRFNERLANAPSLIKTEFCALLPDDEFFLPTGLMAAVNHLDSHPDSIGCVGRCLYFFVDQGRFLASHAYRDWKSFPNNVTQAVDRLEADLPPNKTHMTIYGVFRQQAWQRILENSCRTYFSCGYTYERLMNLQRSALGRTDILEVLLWMRSKENPPVIGPQLPRYGGRDFVSWAKNPEFRNEVEEYRSRAREIITSAGVPTAEIQLLENRFFWGSIRRQEEKEQRVFASLRFKFINFALTSSPKGLRLFAKRHFPKWILRYLDWEGNDLDTMLKSVQRMGTDVNPEELERVKELALETFFSRK